MTSKYFNCSKLRAFSVVLVLLSWFSIPSFAGGDHYEIYLNKKLVSKQFVAQSTAALDLQLDKSNYNDEITIYYSHCGVTGKGRSLVLKDSKGKTLKEWKFEDGKNKAAMTISAKEIIDLKMNSGDLQLYYAATEMPKGRMLASVKLNGKNAVGYQNTKKIDDFRTSITLCFLLKGTIA